MNFVSLLSLSSLVLFFIAASMPLEHGRKFRPRTKTPKILWQIEAQEYDAELNRVQVWDAFADTFLDTSFDEERLQSLAATLVYSPFTVEELAHILRFEVTPVCLPNLLAFPGGEWSGFSPNFLIPRCLKQQRMHPFRSSGNPDKIRFLMHFLAIPPSESYYLLYRAYSIRTAI